MSEGMARKLRPEEVGGLYHVLNRGNFRSWIFGWIAEQLGMGTLTEVSRYASECLWGDRDESARIYTDMIARLKL